MAIFLIDFQSIKYMKIENNLLQTLPIESQCDAKESQLVKYVYSTKLSRVKISILRNNSISQRN